MTTEDTTLLTPARNPAVIPADLERREFPPARMTQRGLDPGTVYDWRDRAAAELIWLRRERQTLIDENTRLRGWAAGQAANVLRTAQQTAEQFLDDSRAEATSIANQARAHWNEVTATARDHAEAMIADAMTKAEQIRGSAPADAHAAVTYYETVARALKDGLEAELAGLLARIRQYEAAAAAGPGNGDAPPAIPPAVPESPGFMTTARHIGSDGEDSDRRGAEQPGGHHPGPVPGLSGQHHQRPGQGSNA